MSANSRAAIRLSSIAKVNFGKKAAFFKVSGEPSSVAADFELILSL